MDKDYKALNDTNVDTSISYKSKLKTVLKLSNCTTDDHSIYFQNFPLI